MRVKSDALSAECPSGTGAREGDTFITRLREGRKRYTARSTKTKFGSSPELSLHLEPPPITQDKCVITLGVLSFIECLDVRHDSIVLVDLFLHTLKTRSNIRKLAELQELQAV
jgi:hypothetical protein